MEQQDTATFIGNEVKGIMRLITEIDPNMPDEDMMEVLIGAVMAWGIIEAQLLLPAMEAAFADAEPLVTETSNRLTKLSEMQDALHMGEGADEPYNALARKYIDAVKYHLIVDVQDIVPLTSQFPAAINSQLTQSMTAMKHELI